MYAAIILINQITIETQNNLIFRLWILLQYAATSLSTGHTCFLPYKSTAAIIRINPEITNNNAILDELESFANAISNNTKPIVTLHDGTEALRVATQIINCFN